MSSLISEQSGPLAGLLCKKLPPGMPELVTRALAAATPTTLNELIDALDELLKHEGLLPVG